MQSRIGRIVNAIQADTVDKLISDIKNSKYPEISSNFCKAVLNFQNENSDYHLFLNFNWANSIAIPGSFRVQNSIKIQKDYFSKIDDIHRELRKAENEKEDVFMATVEKLNGDLNDDGRRSGEVILNLLQEDEIIRARVNLNADQYSSADKAHMKAGAFIKIKGKLHSGYQPKQLTDISFFRLISP